MDGMFNAVLNKPEYYFQILVVNFSKTFLGPSTLIKIIFSAVNTATGGSIFR